MRRIAVIVAFAAINASAIPAVAADCTAINHIDTSCVRLATVNSKQVDAADNEKICRAYAASFYESVVRRQVSASRVDGARALAALDSVINAFNDLLATKCGG
ncbi:hypothetical protein [Bradyrhizobium iriomotense]|uniref:Uncharacterized protein n=1 Tax=Bradyrhizobium iriomotense TaxID=441950 RepID=A0ABQ6AW31_9BRAD|nr:hypothetical protein [Bradyrhizobium iriomotense]GLR84113.1 hypothetical protein GCM10007857_08230 [Bradyrhizobium iriomotense]